MVKDFDSTLTDALDLAARSAQAAGPAAARIRGRQRTMRKRIALSTASLVLIAVGGTAAFKLASPGHDGAPAVAKPSPSASMSTTPQPAAATTSPATAAPSNPASSTSNANTPSSAASTATITADPQQVATTAWLSASQMPFDSTFNWAADKATSQSSPIGQQLTPTVFYVPVKTDFQTLTACGDATSLLSRTIGAQHTDYEATTPPQSGTSNHQASQFIFFFANAEAAQEGYKWLLDQYNASCFAHAPGAQFTKTASSTTEATWLAVKGTSGLPDMPDYEREYFVLRGSTITYVSITSYTQTLATTYDDTAQMSTIAGHACTYGGPCQ